MHLHLIHQLPAILWVLLAMNAASAAGVPERRSPSELEIRRVRSQVADFVPQKYRGVAGAKTTDVIVPGGKWTCYDRIEWMGRPTQPLPVRFCLIPSVEGNPEGPVYVMESKVWNGLFRQFETEVPDDPKPASKDARTNPQSWKESAEKFRLQAKLQTADKLPVFNVPYDRARQFAVWLGGDLPTAGQWDLAAGRQVNSKPDSGPFLTPADGKPLIGVGRRFPWEIDECVHDVSILGCRHMAGNGLEWTSSVFQKGSHRELRGRSYTMESPLTFGELQPGLIEAQETSKSSDDIGFRVVLKIPPNVPKL